MDRLGAPGRSGVRREGRIVGLILCERIFSTNFIKYTLNGELLASANLTHEIVFFLLWGLRCGFIFDLEEGLAQRGWRNVAGACAAEVFLRLLNGLLNAFFLLSCKHVSRGETRI